MTELADIVEQEPILTESKISICPFCDSENVRTDDHRQTMMSRNNHHWLDCYCRDCESRFYHEYKQNNHWYTQGRDGIGRFVLKGVANCFENYVYTCNKCPGFVKRYYTEMDGETPLETNTLSYGVDDEGYWGPKQREFYGCVICDNHVETTKPRRKNEDTLAGWTIEEEESEGYIDPSVVDLITKSLTNS